MADFCGVDPIFGTLADFDAVIERAHHFGIKVLIDQVYAHSSDQHPWFAESRTDRVNPKADWYVWADPREDGTPPNNWQSVFGGPAWTWDARRRQYYMHTFLKEQPQLNLHCPAVQDALLDVARFWLDRGVDGFRLDALNHAMHDLQLRDNPPAPDNGRQRSRPFDFQIKLHSQSQPGMLGFVERVRALCDDYQAIFTMAEIGGDNADAEMKAYTQGDKRLNSAYGFDFLYSAELTPEFVAEVMDRWPGKQGEGWPSWAFENHDAPRAVSRWCAPEEMQRYAAMKMALLLSLRGNPILYQGEELGLEQDHIPFELLQDPEAIANWPLTLSRDGARTPLPWSPVPGGGFTSQEPWLPLGPANLSRAASLQEVQERSLLSITRELLAVRQQSPALRQGKLAVIEAASELLVIERTGGGQTVRCSFNLGGGEIALDKFSQAGRPLASLNGAAPSCLPPQAALWFEI